ncbi:MAG: PAS domain-containing protein [Chloroflexi bacterium]|nr:PAS domain-containing protein [Chloroflexota bacterium]
MTPTSGSDTLEHLLATIKTADGVFAVGDDQRIVHWGPTAEHMLGHPAEAALNLPCEEVIGGRDTRNVRFCRRNCPIVRNARKGRATPDYDILVRSGDGSPKWLNVTVLVVQDKEQHRTSIVHLFRDVTRHRRLEEQARRTMATLKEFVASEECRAEEEPDLSPASRPLLTPRELEVLRLLVVGLSTQQIAESLSISPITARNHLTSLQAKLGAKNRLQAVLYASRYGLI